MVLVDSPNSLLLYSKRQPIKNDVDKKAFISTILSKKAPDKLQHFNNLKGLMDIIKKVYLKENCFFLVIS